MEKGSTLLSVLTPTQVLLTKLELACQQTLLKGSKCESLALACSCRVVSLRVLHKLLNFECFAVGSDNLAITGHIPSTK